MNRASVLLVFCSWTENRIIMFPASSSYCFSFAVYNELIERCRHFGFNYCKERESAWGWVIKSTSWWQSCPFPGETSSQPGKQDVCHIWSGFSQARHLSTPPDNRFLINHKKFTSNQILLSWIRPTNDMINTCSAVQNSWLPLISILFFHIARCF